MPRRRRSADGSGVRGLVGRIFGSLFFLPFLAMGLWFTGLMIHGFFRTAATYLWDERECLIVTSEVEDRSGATDGSEPYRLKVAYTYFIDGHRYTSDQYQFGYSGSSDVMEARRLADRYPAGSRTACYVNRRQPSAAMLRRPSLWGYLVFPLPLIFVAVGGIGLYGLWSPDQAGERSGGSVNRMVERVGPRGCLGVFFSVFLLAGSGFSLFFIAPALKVQEARSWAATPCTILRSEVRTHPSSDSDSGPTYSVDVLYTYAFQGRAYQSSRYQFLGGSTGGYAGKERIVRRLPPLTRTTCYVNPDDPSEAVLNRDFNPEYAFGLVPLLFVLVGLGGLVFTIRGGVRTRGRGGAE